MGFSTMPKTQLLHTFSMMTCSRALEGQEGEQTTLYHVFYFSDDRGNYFTLLIFLFATSFYYPHCLVVLLLDTLTLFLVWH